jgi:ABC-type Zn uptake system ZnuABC Zn-binding protein ZnuA
VHISQADLVIRHDFQSYLDRKLVAQNPGLRVAMLESPGHAAGDLVIPSNHLIALEQVKEILESSFSSLSPVLEANFARACEQIEQAGKQARLRIEAADFGGVKVLASFRQADFVRWAGLEVVDQFTNSPDELSVLRLKEIVQTAKEQDIAFVAGNLHSGGEAVARAIGAETGLPVCILSNFPGTNERNPTYFKLLIDNIERLAKVNLETARP